MMRKFKRWSTVLLIFSLIVSMSIPVYAVGNDSQSKIDTTIELNDAGNFLMNAVTNPVISSIGGEWTIIGLARSNINVPQGYYEKYYINVVNEIKEKQGRLTRVKFTEYSRIILALTAIGKDVTDVGGYNLLEKLADYNSVIKQGINGPTFALIALDSNHYSIPKVEGVPVQTTRQMLIDYILNKEVIDENGFKGGFSLSGERPDPDITGMVLQGLANCQNNPKVKAATDRALKVLDKMEFNDGSFATWGEKTSESIIQVIIAKSALGINPSKNVEALLSYHMEDGGFEHILGKGVNLLASEQGLYALAAYDRYRKNIKSLYDMSDICNDIKVTLNGNYLTFDQAPVNENGHVLVPMRVIFESMGAEVAWDSVKRNVVGTLDEIKIELVIDDANAFVNGSVIKLAVPAKVINGRTMVPVRFISESMNAKVEWNERTKTVMIKK